MPQKDQRFIDALGAANTVSERQKAGTSVVEQWIRSDSNAAELHAGTRKPSILKSLLQPLIILLVVLYLIFTLVVRDLVDTHFQEQHSESLNLAARFDEERVVSWFSEQQQTLKLLAGMPGTRQFLDSLQARYLQEGREALDREALDPWAASAETTPGGSAQHLKEQILSNRHIDDVYLLNDQGRVLFAAGDKSLIGRSVLTSETSFSELSPLFNKVLLTPGEHLLTAQSATQERSIAMMSMPVANNRGSVNGVLVLRVDLAALLESLHRAQGAQYRAYLMRIDRKGEVLVDYRPTGELSPAAIEQATYADLINKAFQQFNAAVSGSDRYRAGADQKSGKSPETISFYQGPDGKSYAAVVRLLQVMDTHWALLATRDRSDAVQLLRIFELTTLGLLLAAMLLVYYLARRISVRFGTPLRELVGASQQIEQGRPASVNALHGVREFDELAVAFKQMVAAMEQREESLLTRMRASEEAIQSLNELKYALDRHASVAVTDVAGTITFVNACFEEISGYDAEELIGQNHRILNSGYHGDAFWREMYRDISHGKTWRAQVRNKAKDGSLYWEDTTVVAFMRDGKPEHYIAIRTDITKGKLAEHALIQAKESAEAGARAKSEFLASMSHEIRTPMNGVLGMLNLIKRTELSEEQRRQVDLAHGSAESLLTIINDILDFSKIEAGKLDLEEMDFDVCAEISQFADTVASRVEEKGLELVLDLAGLGQSWVRGDPGRLRQILINLVGNAIKFTDQGEIVLSARICPAHLGRIRMECSISDTGIGIPVEKQHRLFDSFSQVDASTTRKFGGTGLGLTIVKQLCELMKGTIEVESEPGKGSKFSFSVCFSESESGQAPSVPRLLNQPRVLFADANLSRCKAVRQQCRNWKVNIEEVHQQSQVLPALQVAYERGRNTDVLVIDRGLPIGSDHEIEADKASLYLQDTLRKIRQDGRFDGLKIAMLLPSNPRDCEHDGFPEADATLLKPLKPMDLHALFEQTKGHSPKVPRVKPEPRSKPQVQSANDLCVIAPGLRILLVEDNPVNQLVASALLEQFHLSCDMAGNGVEALAALKNSPSDMPYHLVLMDCQMPEMDGYTTSRKIRTGDAGERYRDILIVAMTANAMKGDREKCLEAGMNDYLSKPIEGDKLKQTLERWLLHEPVSYLDALRTMTRRPPKESAASGELPLAEESSDQLEYGEGVAGEPPAVIWNKDGALQNLGGNEELYAQLVEAALDDIPVNIERLRIALEDQDFDAAKIAAHSIKGVASSIGGVRLMELAQVSELAAREKQLEQLEQSFAPLKDGFDTLYKAMKEE